ncbi:MAG TPA: MarR family transcriptional regulator, partial [Amycolatopsis sp.]|uniref:MarR family winged helix-turn-helix transcriptional regulator n=1 Tax=Amycolatopsis sp. TaxID=37632 RepID=UPI002B472C83
VVAVDTPDAGEQPPTLTPEPASAPPWPHRDPAGPATASAVAPVLEAIRELSAAMDHYRHAFGTAHELGTAEITALTHLLTVEHTTAGRLAARTNLTPGSVTALMDRLERRGYLTRTRPPTNRRTLLIELTDTGRRLAHSMYTPLLPLLETAAADPKAPDPGRMAHCLDQIAELIDHLASTPPTT